MPLAEIQRNGLIHWTKAIAFRADPEHALSNCKIERHNARQNDVQLSWLRSLSGCIELARQP